MVKDRPLRDLIGDLASKEPFTLSRWGDAEWHAMFGEASDVLPANGHFYMHDLQGDLWQVLNNRPQYRVALDTEDARAENVVAACSLHGLNWYRNPFAGKDDLLDELLQAAARKPLVIVGPPRWRHLRPILKTKAFVDVPPRNAYTVRDYLVNETLAALDGIAGPALVSVSAGVCSPLIIDDLHRQVGRHHQLVDFGGLWASYLVGL